MTVSDETSVKARLTINEDDSNDSKFLSKSSTSPFSCNCIAKTRSEDCTKPKNSANVRWNWRRYLYGRESAKAGKMYVCS